MDLDPLRVLVADKGAAILGVPATLTTPSGAPITTKVTWGREFAEEQPSGREMERREPKRVMAIRRSVVEEIPRGTLINAVGPLGEAATDWQVEGLDRVTRGHFHVIVSAVV